MPRATDRRIDKLIHLLVTNATVVVPGPKIASEIGVTRSTVWKWIEELRPPLSPASAPALTLMAGVAAHAAVSSTTGLPVDIRWPNDLLINGKKVCGILTEMNAELDRLHSVVLGIGINVNHREMPPELRGIATSLRIETGKVYARAQVLVSLLKELERHYRLL